MSRPRAGLLAAVVSAVAPGCKEAPPPRVEAPPPPPATVSASAPPPGPPSVCRVRAPATLRGLEVRLGHGGRARDSSSPSEEISRLLWSADGSSVVAASMGSVEIWDVARHTSKTALFEPPLASERYLQHVLVTPQGTIVAITNDRVSFFDRETGRQTHMLALRLAHVSPDGGTVATADGDTIRLRDARSGAERASFPVRCRDCAPRFARSFPLGDLAVETSRGVELHDWATGALRGEVPAAQRYLASPSGRTVAAVDSSTITLIDAASLRRLWSKEFPWTDNHLGNATHYPALGEYGTIAWSPDERTVALAVTPRDAHITWSSHDVRVSLHDARTGAARATLPSYLRVHGAAGLAFSSDGKRIFTSEPDSRGRRAFDARTGAADPGGAPYVDAVAAPSPAGDLVAVAAGEVVLIEGAKDGAIRARLGATSAFVRSISAGAHGVALGADRPRLVTAAGVTPVELPARPGWQMQHARWSPDGALLAAIFLDSPNEDLALALWDASGRLRAKTHAPDLADDVRWSPGGALFATLKGNSAHLFDRDGKHRCELGVARGAWSPDGKLFVGHTEKETQVWSASTCARVASFPVAARGAAFAPEGDVLLWTAAGLDRRDPSAGRSRLIPLGPGCTEVRGFSPDGAAFLAGTSEDGALCASSTGASITGLTGAAGPSGPRWDPAGGEVTARVADALATWDTRDGSVRAVVHEAGRLWSLPYDARGGVIAVGSDATIDGARAPSAPSIPCTRLVRARPGACAAVTVCLFDQVDRTGWVAIDDEGRFDGDEVGLSLLAVAGDTPSSPALAGSEPFEKRRRPGLLATVLGP